RLCRFLQPAFERSGAHLASELTTERAGSCIALFRFTCGALIDLCDPRRREVRCDRGTSAWAGARGWPGRAALLARPLDLSRAFSYLVVARRGSALQTDRHRSRLGRHTPFYHHGDLHHRVRSACWSAERERRALLGDGVRRHATVVP